MKRSLILTILTGGLLALVLSVPVFAAESTQRGTTSTAPAKPAASTKIPGAPAPSTKKVEDLPEIPEAYIREAQFFYSKCEVNPSFFRYYDCNCLAKKYLNRRIDVGPRPDESAIIIAIDDECTDATMAAGAEYQKCLNDATSVPQGHEIEDFCECYANTYVKLFETYHAKPGSATFASLQAQARVGCTNPAAAKELYNLNVKDYRQKQPKK